MTKRKNREVFLFLYKENLVMYAKSIHENITVKTYAFHVHKLMDSQKKKVHLDY